MAHAMESPKSPTKTILYFRKLCKLIYLICATNFWFEEQKVTPKFKKIHGIFFKVIVVILVCFRASELVSLITLNNLPQKKRVNMWMFAISHTLQQCVYINALYYRHQIRRLVFTLAVTLGLCHDESVERAMLKKIWRSSIAVALICGSVLPLYGLEACVESITTDATFSTVTTFWPDVEDRRPIAGAARVIIYLVWWIFAICTMCCHFIMLAITICLGHQFTSLNNYFSSLNDIFEGDGSQEDKEKRYEDAFKIGIKMHSITLGCVRETQETCGMGFAMQIVMNVSVLISEMIQMMRVERTLVAVAPLVSLSVSVLVTTGIFMCNAGEITIEADRLPTAMFFSGWHHCRGSTVRVRKLVMIALAQAQQPVIIKVLGVIELSYQSYVSIVKSSYSLFSVIY